MVGQQLAACTCLPAAAALEWLPTSLRSPNSPEAQAAITQALRLLAAARVCAAPGCGATSGLKRCTACRSVRYCSEACMRAHWKEHRPECKRLRAAAAAAAVAAGGADAGPSAAAAGQQPWNHE